ncbi:hypothetical protein [Thermomonospora cellulosilytica]|uniref:Monooxygenase n=1 Tax=Thermomonospora cellulosilytica TaxID=1411118 RepID=A0A7W3MVL4_9ACTN|nr:hypothetical protein [Thermomonospora cellulosilytica]MBA9002691.1 hypothetical protein [Thermomonospora cellulosilytica]
MDTDGKGVERITEKGVVAAGREYEYELDCIIYASGFEVGTEYTRRAGYDITGRDGVRLSEYWSQGMRTLHGIHVHGFPNMFIVQAAQSANLISNIPHNLTSGTRLFQRPTDCTPGYYNNEGQDPAPWARLNVGHPAGPVAFFKHMAKWRTSGDFPGLQFH